MEQRPVDGQELLAPPSADVARAYLEELSAVQSRREASVDRHGAAWLTLFEAIVMAVYVTIAGFSIGITPANTSFLVVLALLFVWIQLCNEKREGLGGINRSLSRTWVAGIGLGALLVCLLIGRLVAATVGAEIPLFVYFIPGLIALAVIGIPALRDIRSSTPSGDRPPRRPLTASERWTTGAIGAIMTVSIWILGIGSETLTLILAPVAMFAYLAWWSAGRISGRLPVLGVVWRWPQWSAFAVAGGAVAAIMLGQLLGASASNAVLAPFAAAVILLLFIGSAFLDGRDG